MEPMKVDLFIALVCESGQVNARLALWLAEVVRFVEGNRRIGRAVFAAIEAADRDALLFDVRRQGFDLLLLADGALWPDRDTVPFLEVAFPFVYGRMLDNKPTLIGAPYCEDSTGNPLVYWAESSDGRVSRREASLLHGIQAVGAIGMGLCLMSTNVVDSAVRPWFHEEVDRETGEKTGSTDLVFSRNVHSEWHRRLGESVVYCAADSWASRQCPAWFDRPPPINTVSSRPSYQFAPLSACNLSACDAQAGLSACDAQAGAQAGAQADDCSIDSLAVKNGRSETDAQAGSQGGEKEPPSRILESPGIRSLLFAGHRIYYDDLHPLDNHQLAAMNILYEQIRPDRILIHSSGLCDAPAVFAKLAALYSRGLSLFCLDVSPLDIASSNLSIVRPPVFLSRSEYGLPPDLPDQELDMIWFGHPPDPQVALDRLRASRRHLRLHGVMAGPCDDNMLMALASLKPGHSVKWISVWKENRVWYCIMDPVSSQPGETRE